MLKIGDKVFLNIQEAVAWLMANNALPFQSTAAYVADTEISLSTIVNPSPAKVRIGSIVFFADSKAATVTGVTATTFTVGVDHIDMGDIHHVTGDVSITGDLTVSNINVNSNANVGKLNSEELHQKYEGAIKAELHVDGQGIAEAVNPGNTGRFETTRVIKPSEVKTEIYDTQAGKRMSFRLPYFEASPGNHRLLTEEDLGGGGSSLLEDIEDSEGHKRFQKIAGEVDSRFTNEYTYLIINGNSITLVGYAKCNADTGYQGVVFTYSLPEWVSLLIRPVTRGPIVRSSMTNAESGATVGVNVDKTSNNKITVSTYSSYAFTRNTFYRFELTLGL